MHNFVRKKKVIQNSFLKKTYVIVEYNKNGMAIRQLQIHMQQIVVATTNLEFRLLKGHTMALYL